MNFNLKIDIDGAAFVETDDELVRIMRALCDRIEQREDCLPCTLADINGNRVGSAWIASGKPRANQCG